MVKSTWQVHKSIGPHSHGIGGGKFMLRQQQFAVVGAVSVAAFILGTVCRVRSTEH